MAKSYRQKNIDVLRETTKLIINEKNELRSSLILPIVGLSNNNHDCDNLVLKVIKETTFGSFKHVWRVDPNYFNELVDKFNKNVLTERHGTKGIVSCSMDANAIMASYFAMNYIIEDVRINTRNRIAELSCSTVACNSIINVSVDDMGLPVPFRRMLPMAYRNSGINIESNGCAELRASRGVIKSQLELPSKHFKKVVNVTIPHKLFHTHCQRIHDSWTGAEYNHTYMQMQAASQFLTEIRDIMGAIALREGMQQNDMLVMNNLVWMFDDNMFDCHPTLYLIARLP